MKEEESLATEMLRELKANSKRWFIISIVELVLLLFTITLFIAYLNTPIEDTTETTNYTQEADTQGESSPITQNIGE